MPRIERESPSETVRRLVLGAVTEPESVPRLPTRELDLTLRLMRRARLLGRLAWQLRERGLFESLPRAAVDQLLSALAVAESRRRVALWELDRIAWAVGDDPTLPVVALKGCAYLLAGTPNAAGRVFSDVDLMVPEARLDEVEARLKQCGWRSVELSVYDEHYYRTWTHELPPMRHVERDVEIDLHHNILMRTARLKPPAQQLIRESIPVPGSRFRLLSPPDMVLHAMTHLFHGSETLDSIRELVDVADLIGHFEAREPGFGVRVQERARLLDLERPAFYGLRYARLLLGAAVPEEVTAGLGLSPPNRVAQAGMDAVVPRALMPADPESPAATAALARGGLYLRSHWLKMPFPALLRHLSRKLAARYFRPRDAVSKIFPVRKAEH